MKNEYNFSNKKRGAILSTEGMTHVQLHIKTETLEGLQKQAAQLCTGYQTLINAILKKHLETEVDPSDLILESQPMNQTFSISSSHDSNSGVIVNEELTQDTILR